MPSKHVSNDIIAALDLGSNSFHLIVARKTAVDFRVIDKHKETIRLASGFDSSGNLKPEVIKRAIKSLERLGERIRLIPRNSVRIVGTNTLRKAKNAKDLIDTAERIIGHPVDIISGTEEARLIYSGVTKNFNEPNSKYLVVDIGGGSTEIIIGRDEKPLKLNSLHMGCISETLKHFKDGSLSSKSFNSALLSVAQELEPIALSYRDFGWNDVIGSSGTILAVRDIVIKNGWAAENITKESLDVLTEHLLMAGSVKNLSIKGLSEDRREILPGGLAVLKGFFKEMKIDQLRVSQNALREGVLYDLVGRIKNQDIRDRTVKRLIEVYEMDEAQSDRICGSIIFIYSAIKESWDLENFELRRYLVWAGTLSEIGLVVSYSQYHKHGAYLLANLDMPGFSEGEKKILSLLVRSQRRKFPIREFQSFRWDRRARLYKICAILRLALLLHRSRMDFPIQRCTFKASGNVLEVRFPLGWLESHPLTVTDLLSEKDYLKAIGITLLTAG